MTRLGALGLGGDLAACLLRRGHNRSHICSGCPSCLQWPPAGWEGEPGPRVDWSSLGALEVALAALRAQSLGPIGPKWCSPPRLCPACRCCSHLRDPWTCSLEAEAVVWPLFPWREPGDAVFSCPPLRRPSGTRPCGSPTRHLLRALLSRPVLPPGRRLPGPGAEGSQENSGGDPGEGQHRGECVGADRSCCRPHVARGPCQCSPCRAEGWRHIPTGCRAELTKQGDFLPRRRWWVVPGMRRTWCRVVFLSALAMQPPHPTSLEGSLAQPSAKAFGRGCALGEGDLRGMAPSRTLVGLLAGPRALSHPLWALPRRGICLRAGWLGGSR